MDYKRMSQILAVPDMTDKNAPLLAGAGERLLQWRAGRTLTESDVLDLKTVIDDFEKQFESQIDLTAQVRRQALLDVGGEALAKAVEVHDEMHIADILEKAIGKYAEFQLAQRKGSN